MWRLNLSSSDVIKHSDPHKARLGPPFGAPLTNGEAEATGIGRCVLVTEGGAISDGHKATVLDAVRGLLLSLGDPNRLFKDFHPTLNLFATSSVRDVIFDAIQVADNLWNGIGRSLRHDMALRTPDCHL
jgi:hypothetical protein